MLTAEPTKHGAGITLWGDYYDLRAIHSCIHFFCDKSNSHTDLHDFVLALAYDIRHAYQGDRLKKQFGFDSLDSVTYRGVQVAWPTFLPQVALMRQMASRVPHTTFEQACLFGLEDCARQALMRYDATVGTECIKWLEAPCPFEHNYLVEYLNYVTKDFVTIGKAGKARFRRLPNILRSMHVLSEEYQAFAGHLQDLAIDNKCAPEQLIDWSEWPDIKW